MGAALPKFISRLLGWRSLKVIVLGLHSAGKTTILYKLKLNRVISTVPTVGFNVETIDIQRTSFVVWDLGRPNCLKMKSVFHHYYLGTSAIVFVVDSTDREGIEEAKNELLELFTEEDLRGVSLLVLANKQDREGAMRIDEIVERLELDSIKDRRWHVEETCAMTGTGLREGFVWLSSAVPNQ